MKYPAYFWYRKGDTCELLLRFDSERESTVVRSRWSEYPVGFTSCNDRVTASSLTPLKDVWVDVFGVMHSL